jgi:hypothetical protein
MHVQHESMRVREQRHRRIEDAEKRRQFRVAHGLEEPMEKDLEKSGAGAGEGGGVDVQSPVAAEGGEFVDFEGKKRPVKKWLGIW